ncbi:50S ribosomal protein L31 [Candidatus Falkowbacteria bacterium RIFOXYD2_FULL_35_9]|uniref:Large ribosomal subunit protein bL31 n=1 Tax=Candidatus Falkowbacteria bacterium RIFOXYC2_FULL_36_12 TaxID=1798002 RepID=A0A1F5SYR8_9BACT|nr:MAG: 50S ribosomal protein L31 [Candidatus Falkowbacteria bacterium RIFOXYB2_FULL_35_7]OGF31792.1 MAG: 50S ribosomal protein L31 [Candidatus Falkowbacteria bacterium RIFOXYC2_FULL_36_12]OGF33798.1 MAG: 50S ribosomal protein L31 [Candidatus Falkowbacteria bacterium RIFOXYA2_FULL_35_8]OGF48251.1 MAG: 50S ribosomal protein L31 [Candidatus Falkowbacteria bacterium RIFOXYD2_FULL_35_9]
MKADIHPNYNPKAKVICACGNEFEVGSTIEEIKTDLCDLCHPFYTGELKLVDTAGRVDKFKERMEKHSTMSKTAKSKKEKAAVRAKSKEQKKGK